MKISIGNADIYIDANERKGNVRAHVLIDMDNPKPAMWLTPESAEKIGNALLDAAKKARNFSEIAEDKS